MVKKKIPMKGDINDTVESNRADDACPACGKPIDYKSNEWVILSDKRAIHHGIYSGDACYRKINGLKKED